MVERSQSLEVAPLSPDEEAFLRAWSRAALTVPRALDADLVAGQGMSASEYSVLMHLSETPTRTLRMSDLAAVCALSISGMSRIVDRLQTQRLVERRRSACDKRSLDIGLTDAGLARLRQAWPTHLASVRRHMIDHLNGLDLAAITAAIEQFATSDCSGSATRFETQLR